MNSSFCGGPTYDNEEKEEEEAFDIKNYSRKPKKEKKNVPKKMMQTI